MKSETDFEDRIVGIAPASQHYSGDGTLVDAALQMVDLGIHPVPTDTVTKAVLVKWGGKEAKMPDRSTVRSWFRSGRVNATGIGAVTGEVSGSLEVLDFDIPDKHNPLQPYAEAPAWEDWKRLIPKPLFDRLAIYKTVSNGYQVLFRCPGHIEGNQKLARTFENKCLIETRGIGGYVQCPPCDGYDWIQGAFESIPILTLDERDTLFSAARLLDELIDEPRAPTQTPTLNNGERPGDEYNKVTSIADLLLAAGWTQVNRRWKGEELWVRPGKSARDGHSAALGEGENGERLIVFSTEAGLPVCTPLSAFAVFAYLEHNGNYSEAAKALAKSGYGKPRIPSAGIIQSINEPVESATFPLTDQGNAERMVHRFGNLFRYVPAWKTWLVWDGHVWIMNEKGDAEICQIAVNTVRGIAVQAANGPPNHDRKEMFDWAIKCESKSKLTAMIDLARYVKGVAVSVDELDRHDNLINCRSGVVDLATGEIHPHNQALLMTKIVDAHYQPDSRSTIWEDFLIWALDNDTELLHYIWRAVGYSITGGTGEEKAFFLHGSAGANGKSTFVETLLDILGPYSGQAPIEALMPKRGQTSGPEALAGLKGCRLVSCPETSDGMLLDESLVKRLVSGDRIRARRLYCEAFEYRPQAKFWMTGNYLPTIRGTDDAIWRRISVIPFNKVREESQRDKDLKRKFHEDRTAIFSWIVNGCLAYHKYGFGKSSIVDNAVMEYRSDQDVLADFLDEYVKDDPTSMIQGQQLYNRFNDWCKQANRYAISNKAFGSQLQGRGWRQARRGVDKARYWIGKDYK